MTTSPAQIGPYPILRELGWGGMGVIFLADNPRPGRHERYSKSSRNRVEWDGSNEQRSRTWIGISESK